MDRINGDSNGVQVLPQHHRQQAHQHPYHQRIHQSPKTSQEIMNGEEILDKINQLTTKPDNYSLGGNNTKMPTIRDFVIIKPISRGAFGKVFLGYKNTDPSKLFAIKVMRKSEMINKNMVSQVITERNALALSRSPFCVSLFYSLQSSSYVYLVMDYMVGGDLKSLLAMYGYFDESAARFYVAEVALALQYLHNHGIVHRDIKPDNMLLSATGHIKLTDFGLSKIEMRRVDLEISDLMNCSPSLNSRTPGQLLSLTSHLSFGSEKKIDGAPRISHLMKAINKDESSDSEADVSLNEAEKTGESKCSGISPHCSVEQAKFNSSLVQLCKNAIMENCADSSDGSSYHTCGSVDITKSPVALKHPTEMSQNINNNNNNNNCSNKNNNNNNNKEAKLLDFKGCQRSDSRKYLKFDSNDYKNQSNDDDEHDRNASTVKYFMINRPSTDKRLMSPSKYHEDSGVSCRKSDFSSSQLNSEIMSTSAIDKVDLMYVSKDDICCSDFSKSSNNNNHTNEMSGMRNNSSNGKLTRNFKQPGQILSNSMNRRRINLIRRPDTSSSSEAITYGASTGLTQEIDIMGLGSSTPKKRKAKSPIRGVFKVRSLSDDETPQIVITADAANVVFSTPVSSQKLCKRDQGLGLGKLKATRFNLPLGIENARFIMNNEQQPIEKVCTSNIQYLKMVHEDPAMSPINLDTNVVAKTPKNVNTPFRTPKSVRRGVPRESSDKILGTPDYLAPELLTKQGHGPPVDWWALGVCFYEFLTGIPPFNDETPHKVFDNILNKNIEWPEGDEALSQEAVSAVDLMLTMDPVQRPAAKEVQQMPFFISVHWENMENEEPPFVPNPDNPTDTGYFAARNNLQHLKLSNFVFED